MDKLGELREEGVGASKSSESGNRRSAGLLPV
jgi:hypothetical protein